MPEVLSSSFSEQGGSQSSRKGTAMKFTFSYQVEESPDYERESRVAEIEADSYEEAEIKASLEVIAPMVEEGSPYIPYIYGSGKIEEVK
jgi:lipopolysaccharide biosynthesis regulator YciM